MKENFVFSNTEYEEEFNKLSTNEIRAMVLGFLHDYEMPKTKFATRCGISIGSLGRWLNDEEKYGERTLRRIFAFLADYYPHWRDYADEEVKT